MVSDIGFIWFPGPDDTVLSILFNHDVSATFVTFHHSEVANSHGIKLILWPPFEACDQNSGTCLNCQAVSGSCIRKSGSFQFAPAFQAEE